MSIGSRSLCLSFILFVTIAVSGCSKKTPAPQLTLNQMMTGLWYTVADTTKQFVNQVQVPQTDNYTTADYKQFNADSTGTETLKGGMYKFKWYIWNETFQGTLINFLHQDYANQSVAGVLVFAFSRDIKISNLTNSKLQLSTDDVESGDNVVEFTDENYLVKH
jgi:hypothetical protein